MKISRCPGWLLGDSNCPRSDFEQGVEDDGLLAFVIRDDH